MTIPASRPPRLPWQRAVFTSAAIVRRKLVDVEDVAGIADFFAANTGTCVPAELQPVVVEQLTGFATLIRSMGTMRPAAGRG